jgi:dTDP-4-dehydrorhamnose 3,5-epimerase
MRRFTITNLTLSGLKLISRKRLGDSRGFFERLFCSDELSDAGWHKPIAQLNCALIARSGTVKGMHYQAPPKAEMKLVTCIQGKVLDVAVDIRAGSPTFLQWHSEILSADNAQALIIPEGFAHGFQTLTDDVTLLYCHTVAYNPEAERALHAQDPRLSITWPLTIAEISPKDAGHPLLDIKFEGVRL